MVLTSFPGQFLEAEHLPHRLVFGKTHPSFAHHLNKSRQLSAFQDFQKTVPSSLIRHEQKQIDKIMQNMVLLSLSEQTCGSQESEQNRFDYHEVYTPY